MTTKTMPPLQLLPGWYWYDYDQASESDAVDAFAAAHRDRFRIRTVWTSQPRNVILFQVVGLALQWTLGGKPTRGPKGAATTIGDIAQTPTPSPGLVEAVEEISGKSYEAAKAAAAGLGTVTTALLWGGAAVLLYRLYTSTGDD